MVPPDWEHPRDGLGRYIPLYDGSSDAFAHAIGAWEACKAAWEFGYVEGYEDELWVERDSIYGNLFNDWYGGKPREEEYMPCFENGTATHYMMYESTSEGTPISPAFSTPEELAHWLADTGASAFAGMTAPYESWFSIARGGYAWSMVYSAETGIRSGVEGFGGEEE
jgi:hypothetical protein